MPCIFYRPFLGSVLIIFYLFHFHISKILTSKIIINTVILLCIIKSYNRSRAAWLFLIFSSFNIFNSSKTHFFFIHHIFVIFYTLSDFQTPCTHFYSKTDLVKRKFLLAMTPIWCGACFDLPILCFFFGFSQTDLICNICHSVLLILGITPI